MSEKPITKCSGCVFAEFEETPLGEVQVGCDLKRHLKLGVEKFEPGETSFTLKRFCNAYRPEDWSANLDFEDRLDVQSTLMKEIAPRIGFVVRIDHESEEVLQDLNKTLASITKLSNPDGKKPAYVVVINEKVEYNEEIWGQFITWFGEDSETKYHIVQLNKAYENLETVIDEAFTHAQNGWVHCLTSGEEVCSDLLSKIHDFINVKMKMLIMLLPKNNNPFSGLTFPAYLFKFLNGNGVKTFSDDNVDSRGFVAKVLEAEKRGGTKTVYTWEEFNAS